MWQLIQLLRGNILGSISISMVCATDIGRKVADSWLAHRQALRQRWTAPAHKDFRQGSWSAHHCTLATIYCVGRIVSSTFPWKRPMVHETTPSYITHFFNALTNHSVFISIGVCVSISWARVAHLFIIIDYSASDWLAKKWVVLYCCCDVTN